MKVPSHRGGDFQGIGVQRQALFTIQPVHQLLAYIPALPLQQHPNLPVAVADAGLGNLPNPLPQCGPRLLGALEPQGGNPNACSVLEGCCRPGEETARARGNLPRSFEKRMQGKPQDVRLQWRESVLRAKHEARSTFPDELIEHRKDGRVTIYVPNSAARLQNRDGDPSRG